MKNETETGSETRTNLQIMNAEGTITCPSSFKLDVNFNLIELQDYNNGVAGRKYSYGNLRFRDHLESSVALLFLSRTRLVLTGGGIQAAVSLYGLNSFTVVGAIREVHTDKEVAAA